MEAPLHPSICETSVHKLTVYEDRPSHSRRRDRGDLLLSVLSYVYILVASGLHPPLLGSPFSKRKGGVLKDPPRPQAGEVFPLSVGNRIMVAPGASPGRRPPLSVKFWHNPKCHMNYLNYL